MNTYTKLSLMALMALTVFFGCTKSNTETMENLTQRVFTLAQEQYVAMAETLAEDELPRTLNPDGTLVTSDYKWWCSGFYPGALWYIYEYTGDENIRALADRYTVMLEPLKNRTTDHDVGFQLNCSYGNALRLTGDEKYAEPMVTGAYSLATRFNPIVGCTRSWDFVRKGRDWKFPVIIDNMMNMELLLVVADMVKDDKLMEVANRHALTTLQNHFRDNFTTYHLVDYDPATGEVRSRQTVQGYADSSAWARGQAWALYGYTMMFRMTSNVKYLTCAENVARMLLKRLPADAVPYWDLDAPDIPDAARDASAAAIMASAFVELSGLTLDTKLSRGCLKTAETQLRTLASPEYLANDGQNGHFLLRHCVGSLPDNSEVDVPLTYADYYFLEALLRYTHLNDSERQ